jgi:sugar O-acyltransferase (sialic acid O-acetyltransferase NeuD family)
MKKARPIVFMGGSTSFREIQPIIQDLSAAGQPLDVVAILDDEPSLHGQEIYGVKVAGPLEAVHEYGDAGVVFGIGSTRTRLLRHKIISRLGIPEDRFISVIHPQARIYPDVSIGAGSIVHPGVIINADCVLEPFSIVTFNTIVAPGCVIEKYAMVATMVLLLSGARIGRAAFIGARSCISERVHVGDGAFIGLASIITRNIPRGAHVIGNPPRVLYHVPIPDDLSEAAPPVEST